MITDHEHVSVRIREGSSFRSPRCGSCGQHNDTHLSWGRLVAERIGGRPTDYVRTRR